MRADTQRLQKLDAQQLEVLLNGKHIVGSPSAGELRPACTTWVFGSSPAGNRCRLSEGGAVVDSTQIKDTADIIYRHRGAIADGAHRAILPRLPEELWVHTFCFLKHAEVLSYTMYGDEEER